MRQKIFAFLMIFVLFLTACQAETANDLPDTTEVFQEEIEPSGVTESIDSFVEEGDPIFEITPCPFSLPESHIEGETVQCGFVIVPEDHRAPTGPKIKLAVAIFMAKTESSHSDPLLFLSGGPGEKTITNVLPLSEHLSAINMDRDLIFFDQRGVGLSEPALECPEFVEGMFDLLDETDSEVVQQTVFDTMMACKDRLISEGHNLSAYTTAQNAADVEAIRIALGYDQINLFGGSYGSLLAQKVMQQTPDHIRSVIIDSTLPTEKSLLIDIPTTAVNATLHLLEACASDEDCNTAYPDLENVLFDLVEERNADPIPVELINPLDGQHHDALLSGDMVFGNLVFYLYQTPIIPTLPQAIYNVANGDYDLMVQLSSRKLASYDALSRGMQFSVLCADDLVGRTPEDYLEVRNSMPPALAGKTDPEDIIEYGFFTICENWPVDSGDPSVKEPVVSDVPTLVLAGEFDPVTPPEYGRMVAEHLSNSYFFEFPSIGHSVMVSNACARNVTIDFLTDPTTKPDASCRDELSIEFVLPLDFSNIAMEPVTIQEFGIQTIAPAGWTRVAPEYYVSPDTTIELVIKEKTDEPLEDFLQTWGATDVIEEMDVNGFHWSLYSAGIESYNASGYIAAAPSSDGFFLVLIVTTPAQQEKVYDPLLLPIVGSLIYDEALKEESKTDENEITPNANVILVPYESQTFGISGLVPEGWSEVQPGIYARGNSPADQTLVIQKSYPGMTTDELTAALLPGLQLEELPPPSGTYQSADFSWKIYQTEITAPGVGTFTVDFAFAELDNVPHLVLLQAEAKEVQEIEMHKNIFLPMLEALKPIQ